MGFIYLFVYNKKGAVAKQAKEKRSQVVAKAATKAPFSGKIEL